MRYKSFALGGAALAVVTGVVLTGAPAMAQSNYGQTTTTNPAYTGYASPANAAYTNPANPDNAGLQPGEQPADQVGNPSSTLATDSVQDASGQQVGTVRSVRMGANGRASRINISLTRSGRTVSIRARELRFDPASNTLKSTLTLSQISSLPPPTESP
ncbi:MAG TPA: hypothetical protein VKR31_09385 [Rhizomicrobium sp.]|nr:hypothetical protein [Rhizomicrobium sp.]